MYRAILCRCFPILHQLALLGLAFFAQIEIFASALDKISTEPKIKQDVQRVMTVTQKLNKGYVRVESRSDYLIVAGDYEIETRLIISGGNVVGKSKGRFYI